MAKLNMKKAVAFMRKDLEKNWGKINFSYEDRGGDNGIKIEADVTLTGFDDSILVVINAYPGGFAYFRAIFDKIQPTAEVLQLVNKFNNENSFFKAIVRDDNFLEIKNPIVVYDEVVFKSYANEFLYQLLDVKDSDVMKKLASLTSK